MADPKEGFTWKPRYTPEQHAQFALEDDSPVFEYDDREEPDEWT